MVTPANRDVLDEAQRAAVDCPDNPICIIARAGSGKTQVLTHRIARRATIGDLDVRRTLAITFTTKSAQELGDRLTGLLGRDTPSTSTFHAVALKLLNDHSTQHGGQRRAILDQPEAFIRRALRDSAQRHIPVLIVEFSWAQAHGINAQDYVDAARCAGRNPGISFDLVAASLAQYQREKRRRQVLDFDDLLSECVRILHSDHAFAQAQRWNYRHFFVDEYQDTNPLQQQLLDALIGERTDLCVVGDANQAIYGFNGADSTLLAHFSQRYPNATVFELTRNYRSSPGIVELAQAALGLGTQSEQPHSERASTITRCDDEHDEALTIARAVRSEHLPATVWKSQAILARTRSQLQTIAETLDRLGIPFRYHGSPDEKDEVTLCTFHGAKGLEWPIVHIAGIEEGFVPHQRASSADALGEERRLLYVALSRPRRRAYLTWAAHRTFGDKRYPRKPSRWLERLETRTAPQSPRHGNHPVVATPTIPESLADRLNVWRQRHARAASVPYAVILSDPILRDLVRYAPSTPSELQSIHGLGPSKIRLYGDELLALIGADE